MDQETIISLEKKVLGLAWIVRHCFEISFCMTLCAMGVLWMNAVPAGVIWFAFALIWTVSLVLTILGVNIASIILYVQCPSIDTDL